MIRVPFNVLTRRHATNGIPLFTQLDRACSLAVFEAPSPGGSKCRARGCRPFWHSRPVAGQGCAVTFDGPDKFQLEVGKIQNRKYGRTWAIPFRTWALWGGHFKYLGILRPSMHLSSLSNFSVTRSLRAPPAIADSLWDKFSLRTCWLGSDMVGSK